MTSSNPVALEHPHQNLHPKIDSIMLQTSGIITRQTRFLDNTNHQQLHCLQDTRLTHQALTNFMMHGLQPDSIFNTNEREQQK
ncbi:hypothetical protein E2C01_001152 [Portunus trituberculatus]|uniref:Uncharacterized protein n=1 Tax=Portunus trituberculatus TaxID=210409 RepID=A0A5B7CLT7_PORTR|nr:hypothetical protein [Portunus trituberculatus]